MMIATSRGCSRSRVSVRYLALRGGGGLGQEGVGLLQTPLHPEDHDSQQVPPMAKGMRQPQAFRSAAESVFCSTTSTRSAVTWPPISVVYWKDDQNPDGSCRPSPTCRWRSRHTRRRARGPGPAARPGGRTAPRPRSGRRSAEMAMAKEPRHISATASGHGRAPPGPVGVEPHQPGLLIGRMTKPAAKMVGGLQLLRRRRRPWGRTGRRNRGWSRNRRTSHTTRPDRFYRPAQDRLDPREGRPGCSRSPPPAPCIPPDLFRRDARRE